jgi:ribosomal protein S12 methylthiotransferase
MPLQHASNSVLERMRRQITQEETIELIEQARLRIPNLTLRTTMLVGYPQESDHEFQELCDFVQKMEFDRMGVFQYSHEESTRAYDVEDDVPAELKAERANALMEIQQDISTRKNAEKVGKTFKTLFDRKEGGYFVGRTEGDSPEVDNEVLVDAKKHFVRIGDFAEVRITEATEYDIYGEVVN